MKSTVFNTAMRQAFFNMSIGHNQRQSPLVGSIMKVASGDSGIKRVPEWNAHLKLSTYSKLKTQGVMA